MMPLEAMVVALPILMLAAGTLGGWLLCARFQNRLAVVQQRRGLNCTSLHDGQAIHAIDPDREEDFTSGAVRKDSPAGDSAARLGAFADVIKPAYPNSAHPATARGPIGNETAAPCVRNTFSLALGHRLAESARCGDPISLVLVRIDNYQGLCDRYGLQAGNQILDAAGKLFIASVRQTDWVARFDMTAFAFLLPNTVQANAWRVAERLRTTVSSASLAVNGIHIPLTLSLGIAENLPGDSSEAILGRAEEAMNVSIRMGGNRIHSHAGGRLETVCAS